VTDNRQEQFFDDLAWALNSPNLLIAAPPEFTGEIVDEQLRSHLFSNCYIDTALEFKQQRLGLYFESLISYAIQHNNDLCLLARNLAIFEEKRQLGEFDLIFQDKIHQVNHHWELAVKFYLFDPASTQWVGPNARDRLDIKLNKLFTQQLLRQQHPCAQKFLSPLLHDAPLQSAAFIKGYLFYPWHMQASISLPNWINPNHLKGWWCFQHEITECFKEKEASRWAIIPRLQWLSPLTAKEDDALISTQELVTAIETHFKLYSSSPLIAELCQNNTHWQEVSRGFVVPNQWPMKRMAH